MSEGTAAVLGALIGFVGGLIAARATYLQKADELYFKALDLLGGGSQKRNLGIAVIELYWSNKRHRAASVSLLVGAALYLLYESQQKDAAHELHNLDRIMSRLITPEARRFSTQSHYERLLAAVRYSRQHDGNEGMKVPPQMLQAWEDALTRLLP